MPDRTAMQANQAAYPDDMVLEKLRALRHRLPPAPAPSGPDLYPDEYASVRALIDRLHAENGYIPLAVVELAVGAGLLDPAHVAALGHIQLAPGVVVDAARLFWEPVAYRLAVRTESTHLHGGRGGWRYLDRVALFLTVGSDGDDDWIWPDAQDRPMPGSSSGLSGLERLPCRPRRFSSQLGAILAVVPAAGLPDWTTDDDAAMPGVACSWSVADVTLAPPGAADVHASISGRRGRWLLVDRKTAAEAVFASVAEACDAVERALPGDPADMYAFVDMWNAVDPAGGK